MIGRVKFVRKEKSFGFIVGKDGKDYFFHMSAVVQFNEIAANHIVEFDIENTMKGKRAVNIKVIGDK